MSFPRYPKYKPSGVEWLGDVPAHWTVLPLRKLASDATDSFTDGDWIEAPFITDDGVRLLQTGNIGIGAFREQGFRYISEESFRELACTEVRPGDVLICRLAEPVGRACLAPNLGFKMITSVDVCIMKLSQETCPPFVVYLMSSAQYLGFMEGQCRGGTRDRVSRSFLAGVRVSLPHVDEQRAIAEFLDRETAKIDGLIAEQEKLIELLAEKRQAVISHAVTKGLDPAAPLKPSGVEWLGEVPEHWEVVPVASIAKIVNGFPFDSHMFDSAEGTPLVRIRDLGRDSTETRFRGQRIVAAEITNADLLIGMDGDFNVGRWHGSGTALLNQRMCCVRAANAMQTRFLEYALPTPLRLINAVTYATTVKHLASSQVSKTRVAVPTQTELQSIIAFLDRETAKIDGLVSEAEKAIELLRERRSALISAAVTGQIDVGGIIPESVA